MPIPEPLSHLSRLALGAMLAVLPFSAAGQDSKPAVDPAKPAAPAAPLPPAPEPGAPNAPAPKLPTEPGGKPMDPLFIPDIPNPLPPQVPSGPPMVPTKPPMQRTYTVGKFVIKYGTDVRERNPKLPTEADLANSVVSLLEGQGTALFHMPKSPAAGAKKSGPGMFATTGAEQNERAESSDEDPALHPPEAAAPVAPPTKPEAKPAGKPEDKTAKKEQAKAPRNVPKVIPKPSGKVVKLRVSEFGTPRTISAMALLDVYDALVKKLTDRGLIGVYILTDLNPRLPTGGDVRPPGVTDVTVTVFVSEVAKIRTIARKIAPPSLKFGRKKNDTFTEGDLPKINDEDAPDGVPVKDPRHLWIKQKSPIFVMSKKKPGGPLEKPRLQNYLSRLNRFPGRRVDAAVNATGETGKVMLDYLIREQKRFVIYAQESNNGTPSTGEWRTKLGIELRQLANKDDILRLEYTTTDLEKLNSGVLTYQIALVRPDVLKMKAYGLYGEYSAEDVGLAGLNFKGDSIIAGLALTWTPIYWHGFPIDIIAGAEFMRASVDNAALATKTTANFILPYVGLGTERTTDKFSLAMNFQGKASFFGPDETKLSGLGRYKADGVFWIVTGDVSASIFLEPLILGKKWGDLGPAGTKWTRGILANELALIAHAQFTPGNNRLVPQLEMINGGYNTVRGYPESFAAGDSGFAASLEYRLHLPRLFKPADIAGKAKAAKAAEKAAKNAKPGAPVAAGASQKPEEKAPARTDIAERGLNSATSFRLRPGTAGSGADWDLILRGFVDYGKTFNNSIQTSIETNRTLLSAGGGIELQLFKPIYMTIRADYGIVLMSQHEQVTKPVEVGDSRLHISATIAW